MREHSCCQRVNQTKSTTTTSTTSGKLLVAAVTTAAAMIASRTTNHNTVNAFQSITSTINRSKIHQQQQHQHQLISPITNSRNKLHNNKLYVSTTTSSSSSSTDDNTILLSQDGVIGTSSIMDTSATIDIIQQPQGEVKKVTSVVTDDDDINNNDTKSFLSKIYEKIGSIDEDRYIVPEYTNGEVPRVFSSLQYNRCKTNGNIISASHATGSIIGASALIAGTTVGAGVLALPAATVSAGFLPSTVAMLVAYGYMVVSGLLTAELTINRMGMTGRTNAGLLDLYNNSNLLPKGPLSYLSTAAYFFNHYALMVAYIAAGGMNMNLIFPQLGNNLLSFDGAGQLAFATIVGLSMFTAKPAILEKVNNGLVLAVLVAFFAIMASTTGTADFHALFDMSNQHPENIVNCFPILFLAMVYQNVVPTVVTQLEGDRTKIIYSILLGTAVPLVMYIAWNAVVLGNVLGAGIDTSATAIDPLALLQSGALGGDSSYIGPLVTGFSTVAILTSMIGFTYGLVEAWRDTFQIKAQEGTAEYDKWKPILFGLVFVPPLAMSVANPNIFMDALEYGGAFGVSTLFLILPPLMVWKQRYGSENVPLYTKPMVPFGKIPLGSMWKAAGTLIVEQGAEKLGIFHWVQQHLHL